MSYLTIKRAETLPRLKDIQHRVSAAGANEHILRFGGRFRELLDPLCNEYKRMEMTDKLAWVEVFRTFGISLEELTEAFTQDYVDFGRADIAIAARIGKRALELKSVEAAWMEERKGERRPYHRKSRR